MENRWPLERKIMVLVCTLITIIMLMVTVVYMYFERKQAQDIVGQQALTTALTVSEIPVVKRVLSENANASDMQRVVETIREKSGAEFIVIGDVDGIRYTHPTREKIGKAMVGGDNDEALINGKAMFPWLKDPSGNRSVEKRRSSMKQVRSSVLYRLDSSSRKSTPPIRKD